MLVYNSDKTKEHVDSNVAVSKGKIEINPKHEDNSSLSEKKQRIVYDLNENKYFDKIQVLPYEFIQYYKYHHKEIQFIPKVNKKKIYVLTDYFHRLNTQPKR